MRYGNPSSPRLRSGQASSRQVAGRRWAPEAKSLRPFVALFRFSTQVKWRFLHLSNWWATGSRFLSRKKDHSECQAWVSAAGWGVGYGRGRPAPGMPRRRGVGAAMAEGDGKRLSLRRAPSAPTPALCIYLQRSYDIQPQRYPTLSSGTGRARACPRGRPRPFCSGAGVAWAGGRPGAVRGRGRRPAGLTGRERGWIIPCGAVRPGAVSEGPGPARSVRGGAWRAEGARQGCHKPRAHLWIGSASFCW